MYELSWVISSCAQGVLSIMGGIIGLAGLQKRNARFMHIYKVIKLVQYALVLSSCFIIIYNLQEITTTLTEETITEIMDEARARHENPPKIDKDMLWDQVHTFLKISCAFTMSLWTLLGLYGVYIIHSLGKWYGKGGDPHQPRFVVSIPQSESGGAVVTRPQTLYATPLLQGQSPTIPVGIQ